MRDEIVLRAAWEYCFGIIHQLPAYSGGSWKVCHVGFTGVKVIYWSRYPPLGQ